jgi:hypothetical protein
MNSKNRGFLTFVASLAFSTVAMLPTAAWAQNTPKPASSAASASTKDQWIHVRVEDRNNKGETVRVNLPIDMAVKVLPAINKNQLHNGKIHIDDAHLQDVDLRTILDAVRSSKDGEYVTVQSNENNVRVVKNAGYLYIHVTDNSSHHKSSAKDSKDNTESVKSNADTKVEIKVPMKVVDALLSSGKDELDIVAGLRALAGDGDTELVSVKDQENTVRVWIDSKNLAD